MTVVKVVLCILIVFTAIGLACAVAIARSRDAGVGRRSDTPPDPFSHPFGEPRLTPASFAQATPLSLRARRSARRSLAQLAAGGGRADSDFRIRRTCPPIGCGRRPAFVPLGSGRHPLSRVFNRKRVSSYGGGSVMRDMRRHAVEAAGFLAAKTVACATAFLGGSSDESQLGRAADAIQCELMMGWAGVSDLAVNAVLDPVRLLVVAMSRAAAAPTEARQDRWRQVMGALVELASEESAESKTNSAARQ
jgi:hypothetical protein